jgi:hypothetical protein
MTEKLERVQKEAVVVYLKYCLSICLEGIMKPEISSVRMAGVGADMPTEPPRTQICYLFIYLFD